MASTNRTSGSRRNQIELLAEEFVERLRRGANPAITEYTSSYPELAEAIRELFPALVIMEQLKPAGEGQGAIGLEDQPCGPIGRIDESLGRLGDYRLVREIARGGMGVVYEAIQESLGRHVALKILPKHRGLTPSQIERFQLEARSAARLHHGHIVPVYGVGEHQGVHYYAMQFIPGHGLDAILHDLRELRGLGPASASPRRHELSTPSMRGLANSGALARSLLSGAWEKAAAQASNASVHTVSAILPPLCDNTAGDPSSSSAARSSPVLPKSSPDEAAAVEPSALDASSLVLGTDSQFYRSVARIGRQVADALAYAHHQGVLHRDIKPSNLLLDTAGSTWVTDFGLAKVEGSEGPTHTGDIVGTTRYMAPERFAGWSDCRSDVYSLGATLYELLTLQPVFAAATQAELIEHVLHAPPQLPRKLDPKIPRDLETVVLKAIAKEPGDRYPTAQALRDDLQRFLDDRPVLARRSTTMEQSWRWCRRNRLLAATGLAAAAAIVVLAIGATMAALIFHSQRDQIRQAETHSRVRLFEALKAQARAGRFSHRAGQRFASLDALAQAADIARQLQYPSPTFDRLRDEAIACLALPDLEPTGWASPRPPGVVAFTFDPTGTHYALRFRDGTIQVLRVADGEEIVRLRAGGDRDIFVFRFSPNGRYLATTDYPGQALLVWDIERGMVVLNVPTVSGSAVRFSADSQRIALIQQNREL
jgi:serine/threonine protein kinase